MIITELNKFVAEVHYRTRVLLTEKQFDPWLSGEAGAEYFKPALDTFMQKWRCRSGLIARARMMMPRH
jgi:putative SOS response-associated peptidase YedK